MKSLRQRVTLVMLLFGAASAASRRRRAPECPKCYCCSEDMTLKELQAHPCQIKYCSFGQGNGKILFHRKCAPKLLKVLVGQDDSGVPKLIWTPPFRPFKESEFPLVKDSKKMHKDAKKHEATVRSVERARQLQLAHALEVERVLKRARDCASTACRKKRELRDWESKPSFSQYLSDPKKFLREVSNDSPLRPRSNGYQRANTNNWIQTLPKIEPVDRFRNDQKGFLKQAFCPWFSKVAVDGRTFYVHKTQKNSRNENFWQWEKPQG